MFQGNQGFMPQTGVGMGMYNGYSGFNSLRPQQPSPAGIQFVAGRQGAEEYVMAPNSNVLLMDSNKPQFFIKSADANGCCSIKIYDFVEHIEPQPQVIDPSNYLTRREFNEAMEELKKVIEKPAAAPVPKPSQPLI